MDKGKTHIIMVPMPPAQAIHLFRKTALAEAISYLVLLGIAMPLKYIWGQPLAVKLVGGLHGLLFVLFCLTLLIAMRAGRWSLSRAAMLFVASLIPLIPFWLDSKIRHWADEASAKEGE
jgi:integral membrane protein